jgi:hypothetical protein
MPTIAGNVGGTSGSGALIQLRNKRNSVELRTVADSSGDYTFTVADNDTYLLDASIAGFVIRQKYEVRIVNGQNVSAVNFTISSINSANS